MSSSSSAFAVYLIEIDGQIDFVEFHASGQGRTLPPGLGAIDCILWRMIPFRHTGITVIADLKEKNAEKHTHVSLKIVSNLNVQHMWHGPKNSTCSTFVGNMKILYVYEKEKIEFNI